MKLKDEITKLLDSTKLFLLVFLTSYASYSVGVNKPVIHDYINQKTQAAVSAYIYADKTAQENTALKSQIAALLADKQATPAPATTAADQPPAREPVATSVAKLKKYYLLLNKPDGSLELRTGGNVSWRYNNPGKILWGAFAKAHGAITNDGKIAIFPDYVTGRNALEAMLFEDASFGFTGLHLDDAIVKYAPRKDGYNSDNFAIDVLKEANLPGSRVMSELDADERDGLMEALQKEDGYTAGNIITYKDAADFKLHGYYGDND